MKNILVNIAAFTILATLLTACTGSNEVTGNTIQTSEPLSLIQDIQESQSEPQAIELEALPESVTFSEFSISLRGSQIEFKGLAMSTVNGLQIGAYCGDQLIQTGMVDSNNEFSILASRAECNAGEKAYAEARLGALTFKSQEITIPARMFGGSRGGTASKTSSPRQAAGVPEFSTFTLGLAIVTVGLGIALINKNKA